MGYNHFIISPSSFTLTILIIIIFSSSPHLIQTNDYSPVLNHICFSNTEKYTQVFGDNLNNLLTNLSTNTYATGFWNGSSGQDPDQAYVLVVCRGDLVSTPSCRSCVGNGSSEITARYCPESRSAIVWYNDCYLMHADYYFFGKNNPGTNLFGWNINPGSNESADEADWLMKRLSIIASDTANKYMYASGDVFVPADNVTIHETAQCSGDLSHDDCTGYLFDYAMPRLPIGNLGGRFLSESCVLRFETYNFTGDHQRP